MAPVSIKAFEGMQSFCFFPADRGARQALRGDYIVTFRLAGSILPDLLGCHPADWCLNHSDLFIAKFLPVVTQGS